MIRRSFFKMLGLLPFVKLADEPSVELLDLVFSRLGTGDDVEIDWIPSLTGPSATLDEDGRPRGIDYWLNEPTPIPDA